MALNEVAYLPEVEDIYAISEAIDRSSTRDDLIIETGIEMKD